MATKTVSDSNIYQIKVTLLGTKPPIWRRLLVPADVTLAQLHNVLQIAMGWEDGHMHEFRVGQRRFGQPEPADLGDHPNAAIDNHLQNRPYRNSLRH